MKKKLGDYTVVLVKPDGVEKGIVGELVTRFEKVGLRIAAAKLIWVDKTHVGKHYKDDNQ
jgi:nucleoside-diphosphate kinase